MNQNQEIETLNGERLIAWLENEIAIANRLAKHYAKETETVYNYAFFEGRADMAQLVIDTLRKSDD